MLAGDGAAHANTEFEDLATCRDGVRGLLRVPIVEEYERVQVSVPGMEDVADRQPIFLPYLLDVAQRLRDLGAGNHPVLHVIGRRNAAHRAKSILAAGPQQLPRG